MRILQITASFAPRGASQAVRTVNIAKSFHQFGHSIEVLTYNEQALTLFSPYDDTLASKVPREVPVHRIPPGLLRRWLVMKKRKGIDLAGVKSSGSQNPLISILIPDPHVDAVPAFIRAARRIVTRYKPEVVITHAYPFSTHVVGYLLKDKYPDLIWAADYGDPWYGVPITELYQPGWRKALDYRLEKRMLRRVDLISVTTEPTRSLYARAFPEVEKKIHVVPMGYDPDDFSGIDIKIPSEEDRAKVRFVHTGRLYNQARDPRPLIDAAEKIMKTHPGLIDRLSINLVGEVEAGFQHMINISPARKAFRLIPWVTVKESIAWMKAADYLLLFGNKGSIQIPGKLYQYIGSQKPIVSFYESETDPALEIIRDCDGITVKNTCDEIVAFLMKVLKDRSVGMDTYYNRGAINKYSWPEIVKDFVHEVQKKLLPVIP